MHTNYLRAYTADPDILRMLGVRYIVTKMSKTLRDRAALRAAVTAPDTPGVPVRTRQCQFGDLQPHPVVKAASRR